MQIEISKSEGVTYVELRGRLDAMTSPQLERELAAVPDGDLANVCISAKALDYVSSAGLRVFLGLSKRCEALRGKLVLHSLQPAVANVFEITGFAELVAIAADLESARSALR